MLLFYRSSSKSRKGKQGPLRIGTTVGLFRAGGGGGDVRLLLTTRRRGERHSFDDVPISCKAEKTGVMFIGLAAKICVVSLKDFLSMLKKIFRSFKILPINHIIDLFFLALMP